MKLEEMIERLREIVSILESGDVDLEAAVELYREGKRIYEEAIEIMESLKLEIEDVEDER